MCLDTYKDDLRIYQIAGHIPASELKNSNGEVVVLTNTSSWGWATWERAWRRFDQKALGWEILNVNKKMRKEFNLNNNYDYYTMLKNQMLFNIDSWAIRWYWSVFKERGLTIYPPVNLVDNCGMSGDGTHGRGWFRSFGTPTVANANNRKIKFVKPIHFNQGVQLEIFDIIWGQNGKHIGRLVDLLKKGYWFIRYQWKSLKMSLRANE
jgi:hypothetical protein